MTRRAKIVPDYDKIVRDNYEKAVELDAMPSGGLRSQRGTEFQIRRHAQIAFLQGLWIEFFPDHPVPNHADLADLMGAIKTDSVGDALYLFGAAAKNQHVGRGVIIRDKDGKPKVDESGKIRRTPRKIKSMLPYLRGMARKMFKDGYRQVDFMQPMSA